MADEQILSPTPQKRPFFGLLSRGLASLENYARDPNNLVAQALPLPDKADRVGLTAGLVDLLGVPEAQKFLEKLAYGDRLTSGSGQTLKPADNVVEGALTLAPIAQGLASGVSKLASKTPVPRPSQVNSLFSGLSRSEDPAPDLWLSHGSVSNNLLRGDDLVRELYNPSFAITKDKLSTFGGADVVLVPRPEKLDPKNAKTILTATDSYNPRWHAAQARRIDDLPYGLDLTKGLADARVNEFINQRLYEKFGTVFPKGGIKQEGYASAPRGELPKLGQGLASVMERWNPVENSNDVFSHRILASPRFQSLDSFARSPYGGQLVGGSAGYSRLNSAESAGQKLIENLGFDNGYGDINPSFRPLVIQLKALASDSHFEQLNSRQKTERILDKVRLRDPATNDYRPLTDEEQIQLRQTAGKILQQIKTAPSDYAELKAYGPWRLSADNVAGIIGRKGAPDDALAKAAKARGIPYEPADTESDAVEAAKWLLSQPLTKRSTITRGLAGDLLSADPGPSKTAGDYASVVDKVKTTFKALKASPDNPEAFAAFKKAADYFKADGDIWIGDKLSKAEHGAMTNWLDKQLATYGPKAPVGEKVPTGVFDWDTPDVMASPTSSWKTPSTKFPGLNQWHEKLLSTQNYEGGVFDYLPDSDVALLSKYAADFGHKDLEKALESYSKASMAAGATITEPVVDALTSALKEWDKVVAFNQKPAGLSTGLAATKSPAAFDLSNKSLAELKAMDVSKFSKAAMVAYDDALEAAKKVETSLATGLAAPEKQIASMTFDEFKKINIDSLNEAQLKAYIKAADTFNQFNYFKDETDYLWALGKAEFNLEKAAKAAPAAPLPSLAHPQFTKASTLPEILSAIKAYHEQKPWYYSAMDFKETFPHLTFEQSAALADYSWSLNNSAQAFEKDPEVLKKVLHDAFGK